MAITVAGVSTGVSGHLVARHRDLHPRANLVQSLFLAIGLQSIRRFKNLAHFK